VSQMASPVALITGGSRGIGLATASALAHKGYRLMLAARSESQLASARETLMRGYPEVDIRIACVDVAEETQVKALFQQLQADYKQLDVLVNCAGIMSEALLAMTRTADLQQTFAVNVFGSYYCCQYASRLMARKQRGVIINLASAVGEQGASGQSAYAASKSAISGLTRSLSRELAPQGIRVNAVAPGFIETEMTADYNGERKQQVVEHILLGRPGQAAEVAALIAFLASDQASYITGQVVNINGGLQL
jgi:3-oxoacyl-[acyl-carrier protein] reductase